MDKDRIANISRRVMETFSKNYLRAYKYVSIRDAKAKRTKPKEEDSSLELETKVLTSTPSDPHRPRKTKNKYTRDIAPKLTARITSWDTLDSDVDPYVAFIVQASIGDVSSSVYRRYNAFKKLNQKLGPKAPEAKKLFPTTKAFEGRSFDYNYLTSRKEKLQQFLDSLLNTDGMHDNEFLIEWLGLKQPEDPKMAEVFDIAFTNTKWRLWIWKRIPYDYEEEAIAKLVVEEVKREMWSDIVAATSGPLPIIRDKAIQAAYKTLNVTVAPIVETSWKAAKQAVDPIKPKVNEIVENNLEKLLNVEDQIKNKLSESIMKMLEPIIEQLKPVLQKLTEKFSEPTIEIMKDVAPARREILNKMAFIVESGNENQVKEVSILVKEKKITAEEKVNALLHKSVESTIGELSAIVTIEALSELFSPLKKLVEVIKTTFELVFDPSPHERCIEKMCHYRQKLENMDLSAGTEQVEDCLDEEESWVIWCRWWSYWTYRYKAWTLYYHTWGIPELSSVSLVVKKSAFDFAVLQKKWIKRWSYRFGDHLHERAKTATVGNWKQNVKECFAISYEEANAFFKKRAYEILEDFVLSFFFAAIGVRVEEFLMKGLKEVIEPLSKAIPPPLDEILEIDNIARESINKALKDSINKLVEQTMMNPFLEKFNEEKFD